MNLKERTDGLFNAKSFSICGCPIKVIQEFSEFCMSETKNDYSMGLKILMERNKINFQQEVFAMKIAELEARLSKIEENPVEEQKPKVKTFGKKEGEKNEQTK